MLSLLDLPDPCLLAVLQCCATDGQRSLFNAARAHSRLHQAAAAALRSITAVLAIQQQVEGVLHYLSLYRQHLYSLDLTGNDERSGDILELPPNLQLESLQLSRFNLQLMTPMWRLAVISSWATLWWPIPPRRGPRAPSTSLPGGGRSWTCVGVWGASCAHCSPSAAAQAVAAGGEGAYPQRAQVHGGVRLSLPQ